MIIRIMVLLFLTAMAQMSLLTVQVMAKKAALSEAEYAGAFHRLDMAWRENSLIKAVHLNERSKSLSSEDKYRLARIVSECSKANGHDPFLLLALIEVESGYDGDAVSEKGAMGFLQVMPFVAQEMADELDMDFENADGLYDMETNVRIGSHYLGKLMQRYGDLTMALEAYNLGPAKLQTLLKTGRLKNRYTKKTLQVRDRLRNLAPSAPVQAPA
jgi:soluble lytic murein transglycosylase-like protein